MLQISPAMFSRVEWINGTKFGKDMQQSSSHYTFVLDFRFSGAFWNDRDTKVSVVKILLKSWTFLPCIKFRGGISIMWCAFSRAAQWAWIPGVFK